MKLHLKDKIFLAIVTIGLILFFLQKIGLTEEVKTKKEIGLKIGNKEIRAEVVSKQKERVQGLSDRENLALNQGMLFVHKEADRHIYVMRRMNFDLDFIFIKKNKVVDIAQNVAKEYPGQIRGGVEYDKVLEVPAGWARINGVKVGDKVDAPLQKD